MQVQTRRDSLGSHEQASKSARTTPAKADGLLDMQTIQRVKSDPSRLTSRDVAVLQRSLGNAAVAAMLAKTDTHAVQRQPVGPEGGPVQQGVETRLHQSQGGGSALPDTVRRVLEPQLGADLSTVKVHTGSQATQLTQELGAKAFTHKNHIYYGKGQSPSDLKLTAHETVHTIQQGAVSQRAQRSTDGRIGQEIKPMISRKTASIQRYASNVLSSPGTNWHEETANVTKSGEGISGGVFFFQGNEGPIDEVVVKPEYFMDSRVGSLADGFLRRLGVNVPQARVIAPNSAEAQDLLETSADHDSPIQAALKDEGESDDPGMPLKSLKIMGRVSGRSLSGTAKKAKTPGDLNTMVSRLNNPAIFTEIGRILVIDGFMGNRDRVSATAANLGNFMLDGSKVAAIDSESSFRSLTNFTQRELPIDTRQFVDLFDNRQALYDALFEGIKVNIEEAEKDLDLDDYEERASERFQTYIDQGYHSDWIEWLDAGFERGMNDISRLLNAKDKRKDRKALKKQMQTADAAGVYDMSWDAFRVRKKYFNLRQGGKDSQTAMEETQQYNLYRKKRQNRRKGLKWTAKAQYMVKKRFG